MTTRAKFRCNSVSKSGEGEHATYSVSLSAVPTSDADNNSLLLDTVNAKDGEQFQVGAEYYVDVTKAPDAKDS